MYLSRTLPIQTLFNRYIELAIPNILGCKIQTSELLITDYI